MVFVVPGPPIPCARARVTGRGNFLPTRSRNYQNHVKTCALVAAAKHGHWNARAGSYGIKLAFFKADARRADFDNLAKSLTDPLSKLLYPDDSKIVDAHVTIDIDRANPRVEVTLEAL